MSPTAAPRFLGALEGFYGQPYADDVRLDLVRFLATIGATDFAYAPKGDPYQRERWREPYPPDRREHFRALIALGAASGVRIGFTVSPGLDWAALNLEDDIDALVAKLRSFYDLGARCLGIAFDDVPAGGGELGTTHAHAISAAVERMPLDVTWSACPVDYSTTHETDYLSAFVAGLPASVSVMWTGPGIVAPTITAGDHLRLARSLGLEPSRVVLADNFPVNDGPMSGVLHLGPYPERDPLLPAAMGGLLLNLMPGYPLASRVGLQAGVEWWLQPSRDREEIWESVIGAVPGLWPLARASRSWLTDPGPDRSLCAMSADALQAWLAQGCRDGLEPAWQSELELWLQAWEWEAFAMAFARHSAAGAIEDPRRRAECGFGVAEAMRLLRGQTHQLFGIRYAVYPATRLENGYVVPDRAGVVYGRNLTDLICEQALTVAYGVDEGAEL